MANRAKSWVNRSKNSEYLFFQSPRHFRQCCKPWEGHVFHLFRRRHVFCPELSLRPQHMLGKLWGNLLGNWLVVIDHFQRKMASYRQWLFVSIFRLIIVKVSITGRSHDDIMSRLGCGNPTLFPAPRHHDCVWGDSTFQDFIPANQPSAFRTEKLGHPTGEVTLKFFLILEPELLNACLCISAGLPLRLDRFVSSDMNELRGEDLQDLC